MRGKRVNLTGLTTLDRLKDMKTLSVADLKTHFSAVISELRNGKQVAITYGRHKEPLATIVPQSQLATPDYSIKLGDLKKAGWTYKLNNFEMSDQELLWRQAAARL